jgi:hypothetical protein
VNNVVTDRRKYDDNTRAKGRGEGNMPSNFKLTYGSVKDAGLWLQNKWIDR